MPSSFFKSGWTKYRMFRLTYRKKRLLFSFVALFLSVCIALFIAEKLLQKYGKELDAVAIDFFGIPLDNRVHRKSEIPGLHWELVPNSSTYFFGRLMTTNSLGLRTPEVDPKGDATRILMLGDSITFGDSINQNQSFSRVLEKSLNKKGKGRFEVINAGVSGYNFIQSKILYDRKASKTNPDLVIVGFFDDDLLPPYVPGVNFRLHRLFYQSHLVRVLSDRINVLLGQDPRTNPYEVVKYENDSLKQFLEFYEELKSQNRRLLLLIHPNLQPNENLDFLANSKIIALAQDHEIPYLSMLPLYILSQKPLTDYSIDPAGNPHPNAMGHQFISDALLSFLNDNPGLLKRRTAP
jgi:lysophospholipase L1-like esterase